MKVSMEWLREWVDVGDDAQSIAEELTVAGLEVDDVVPAAPRLQGVKVAHVRDVRPHPDADRLSLCTVFDGTETLGIVCGAPNVRAGTKVALAPIGAVLPGGLKIKAARIRGQQSMGMLCSARELALSEDASGLLLLDEKAEAGTSLEDYLRLPDAVIDIDLTANRGDCFSIIGVARELAARRDGNLRGPSLDPVAPDIDDEHPALLEASVDCPRFVTRIVKGLRADARTPDWMQERLRRVGLRPISPVVDVTNYVMWELGQPLHAYSAARLSGQLRARRATRGESLTLLDGTLVELTDDVLVIADDSGAIGLAGIMGGSSTAIDAGSVDIVLESAFFAPDIIQGRARRYGLHTDASLRFERGVDPAGQVRAIERATALLKQIAGGHAGPVAVAADERAIPHSRHISLKRVRVAALLGTTVADADIVGWLTRLGMTVEPTADGWQVCAPSHRFDIAIEEDLIEEIGRMMGYDAIEPVPGVSTIMLGYAPEDRVESEEVADILVARGYDEIISYSFIEPSAEVAIGGSPGGSGTILANPISRDLSVMRGSLWPGLIRAAQQNLSRQRGRCRLFEVGTVFSGDDEVQEATVVAGLVTGSLHPEHWDGAERDADFFDVKSDVEALLSAAGVGDRLAWKSCDHRALNPASATAVMIGDECVGHIGDLHPAVERQFDLRKRAIVFELDVDRALQVDVTSYRAVSRFPHVRRDLAVVVDESINAADLTKVVALELGESLYRTIVFDEYRGKTLESGRKSVGLGLILQDASRTLTDADADRMLAAATRRLELELGATIRT